MTAKASIGRKVAINPAGYDIMVVREKVDQLKQGPGSLKLTFEGTPAEAEENP